jgi:ABC-2 type transport system permease protein
MSTFDSLVRIRSDLVFFGRNYLRNRVGLFFALIFPVILIIIFGAIFSGGSSGPTTVYVQNNDNGPVSPIFINTLNSTGTLRLYSVAPSENFTQYLSSHSVSDGIVIPSDFSRNYVAGIPINITVYGNPSSSTSAIVSGTVGAVINAFNLQRVKGTAVLGMEQTTIKSSGYKYVDFLVPGLIGFSVLVSPMFSLVNISSQYKKIKLFKQLSLTPLTRGEWLVAKILWYIILGVVSFVVMVAAGTYLFGANITLSRWIAPFLILGPMFFASLGMLVGTVAKSVETAAVVGQVITFPMMFLSGTFFPIAIMPPYLQAIAHIFPLFYIVQGLNAIMVYTNYAQAAVDLIITLALAIIGVVAAARLFKWRED